MLRHLIHRLFHTDPRHQIGQQKERQAKRYLSKQGLLHIASNVRFKFGELDLVMHDKHQDCLVFVEVRYRSSSAFGDAIESVSDAKMRRLELAAEAFIQKQSRWQHSSYRFDIIAWQGALKQPTWLKDVS